MNGTKSTQTDREVRDETAGVAGVLKELGVGKGDRVISYMPMVAEAAVAMLGCARIGAVHSVVFGGFAPHELATRINDCAPKAIVTASCGIEPGRVVEYMPTVSEAIDQASHKVGNVVEIGRASCRGRVCQSG